MHDHAAGGVELPVLVTAVVLGAGLIAYFAGYLALVVAAGRRGRTWPWWRTASAGVGVLVGLAAVLPQGLAGRPDFVSHMWGHLLLGMVAPMLLAVSAPGRTALRGLPVRWARRFSRLMNSGYVRFISRPIVALVLNAGGLWLVYTTALFGWMHTSVLWHLVIHAHVLLAGLLLTEVILQMDPAPHPRSPSVRALTLVAFLALHSILAKYLYAHPPVGVPEPAARSGAELMYYGGDWVDVALIALFCWGWYQRSRPSPRRQAPRTAG